MQNILQTCGTKMATKKKATLFPTLTQKQLIKMLTPKQKALVEELKEEGVIFKIRAVNQRPWIDIIERPNNYRTNYGRKYDTDYRDYDEEDYEIGAYDLCVDGWD